MTESRVAAAQAWLAEHESDLIADLQTLLRFPSIETEPVPGGPYGQANLDALHWMLGQAEAAGIRTVNQDGYGGYAEFGSGDKQVLTMGHLDVVPVGPGWSYDPFGATIADDGYLYARGAVDDKGPTMAMFYAARAIQATWPDVPVRIRSFFGCDEESGFGCVHHYRELEEPPTVGVAPDAGWPLVHGEKGIADFLVESSGGAMTAEKVRLVAMAGGQRPNIVIDHATARVKVSADARGHVEAALAKAWDRNVTANWQGDELAIEAVGKAAHGSTPFMGDNAAGRIFRLLREISPHPDQAFYHELVYMAHPAGDGLGIAGSDDPSGILTSNLGIVELVDGVLRLTINVRYPVTFDGGSLQSKAEAKLAKLTGGFRLAHFKDSVPLYFPKDHALVRAICESYEEETGEQREPGTMGGGTYARAVENCVAIGTGWAGDGEAHQTDERVRVEHVHKMARIYARILVKLVDVALAS